MLGSEQKLRLGPCAIQREGKLQCIVGTHRGSGEELQCGDIVTNLDNKPRLLAPRYASEAFVNLLGASVLHMLFYAHCRGGSPLKVQAYVKVTSCVPLTHCISSFPCHDSSVLLLTRNETLNYSHCNIMDMIFVTKNIRLFYTLLTNYVVVTGKSF